MAAPKGMFLDALKAEGVTGRMADLANSIYTQESGGGKNTKTSNAGAVGGMQIVKGTFDRVADKGWDINDPMSNARAGIRELVRLDKLSGGDSALTASGYYGGEGGMRKAMKGIPTYDPRNPNAPSTLEYGQQVVARMNGEGGSKASPVPSRAVAVPVATSPTPAAVMAQAQPGIPPEVAPQEQVVAQQVAPQENAVGATPVQGPDPWQAFLQTMNSQAPEPVTARDLAYGSPLVAQAHQAMYSPSYQQAPVNLSTVMPAQQQVSIGDFDRLGDYSHLGSWGGRNG